MKKWVFAFSVILGLTWNCTAQELVHVTNIEDLVTAVNKAAPGTTIQLAPGTYRGGLVLDRVAGSKGKPVVLTSADPDAPAVFRGGNTALHLTRVQYVELRNLILEDARGNGLNIDDGGQRMSPSHHVTLRGLTIRNIGPKGNRDGIKLSGVDDFLVEDCLVEQWGDGGSAIDLVGCHRGRIVNCKFQKARGEAANGVQAKGGSSDVIIEQCMFLEAGGRGVNAGGSTGLDYFRPPGAKCEARDITIQDCFFVGISAPVAFVGVDGALAQHNTVYRPRRWVFRILQENQTKGMVSSRNGKVLNNLIVFNASELRSTINIGPKTEPDTFQFAGNAWYCQDRPSATRRLVRLPVEETDGVYGVDPMFEKSFPEKITSQEGQPLHGKGVRSR